MEQNLQEANSRFEKKKREEILAAVPARFHDLFDQALDYEQDEEYEKTAQICKEILAEESNERVKIVLARVYPKLLREDVEKENQKYQQDVADFFEFLDGIQMNDLMQEYVVETLVRLCEVMENDWYRPLFKEFVETIEKKKYLTREVYQKTLDSAYASMESFSYYTDPKVSMILRNILKAGYDRAYTTKDQMLDCVNGATTEIDILMHDWYMCQYYEANKESVQYVKEAYPHSYKLIETLIVDIQTNKEEREKKTLDALTKYVADGVTREALMETLQKSYEKLSDQEKQPQIVYAGGQTYQRNTKKIGRNDLCPCGSGRKYKQCCGRKK